MAGSTRPTQQHLNHFVKSDRSQNRSSADRSGASRSSSQGRFGAGRDPRRSFNHNSRPLPPREKQHRAGGFSPFQLRLVHSILTETLTEGRPLDKAYAIYFAKVKLDAVEQGFIIKQINNMLRRLSFYALVANLKRPSDFARHVNRLITVYCADKDWPVPELDCGEGFDRAHLKKRLGQARNEVLLNQGCPIWLNELGQKELKEDWPAERLALSTEPRRFIRCNELKGDRDTLASRLSDEGVVTRAVRDIKTALEVTSSCALFRTQCFKEGLFEQQDAGSQLIAPFCKVKPHQCVIDACAGAGGKTLHLAALMEGRGQLIALDTAAWRLEELKKRARRAGAFNIEVRLIDSSKVIKRLEGRGDCVLIDAPCSGTGVLRRTPDSKWRDSTAYIKELRHTQAEILNSFCRMVKPGGLLVYSTCSILPSENRAQVDNFLSAHPEFTLEEDRQLLPSMGYDGFYMARMRKSAAPAALKPEAATESAESEQAVEPVETAESAAPILPETQAEMLPQAETASAAESAPAPESTVAAESKADAEPKQEPEPEPESAPPEEKAPADTAQ